ncbi:MAG TPA: type II toxin-antitoxin system PemK/MazF family toxin [Pirellulales bacterium]|nr:type II toxin-antitoxin system PemK/MazF family toxin [Pirellulales bacterium]
MKPIQRGTIIWAAIADKERRSESKERPALVVSSNERIAAGDDLAVLVISTKFAYPPPPHWFLVPSDPSGHPVTGLDQPSVVKTDWPERIPQSQVLQVRGRAPAALVKQVINYLKQQIAKRPPKPQ